MVWLNSQKRVWGPDRSEPAEQVRQQLEAFYVPHEIAVSKKKVPFLGVLIMRIIIYWGLFWGPPICGNGYISQRCSSQNLPKSEGVKLLRLIFYLYFGYGTLYHGSEHSMGPLVIFPCFGNSHLG